MKKEWKFMLDQGGTFTDIIGIRPDGKIISKKILSAQNSPKYNPISNGISQILNEDQAYKKFPISEINIGTTVGTNTLLERNGAKILLCVTKGFKDNFIIGNQKRENLFSRHHKRKDPLYFKVAEIDERISKTGKVLKELNYKKINIMLKKNYNLGIKAISIVLINSFKHPSHELKIKSLAKKVGYKFVSCSSEVSPTINFTLRGYTTLADNYLNPRIEEFTNEISKNFNKSSINYMQSSGFLSKKDNFRGKTSILSGPAGGVNAGVYLARKNRTKKVIGFDMGGTSTDVWHFNGDIEKRLETKISGIYLKTPVLNINTIAAGGGSLIKYKQKRFLVGPESAGSFPGPTCYRNNGPLTITDCNLILGRIVPNFFPKFFGKNKNQRISFSLAKKKFTSLLKVVKKDYPSIKNINLLAEAFLEVAVENMCSAIKRITSYKGYDLREYSMLVFGSASGQLACRVAEKLDIKKIFFHPLSGYLSAYGVGLSKIGETFEISCEKNLSQKSIKLAIEDINKLIDKKYNNSHKNYSLRIKYFGSNTLINIPIEEIDEVKISKSFKKKHLKNFGFYYDNKKLVLDSIEAESSHHESFDLNLNFNNLGMSKKKRVNFSYDHRLKSINSNFFKTYSKFNGFVLFNDFNTTLVIEKNWTIKKKKNGIFEVLKSNKNSYDLISNFSKKGPSPEKLEIFNNLFFSVAEQMGEVLKNTAQSINVKERMDFSCALFNFNGDLIANAPHIPIHLGAMSDTIKYLIRNHKSKFLNGETLLHNDPYSGGTHLPDLTVVKPFLNKKKNKILFFLANRAHHSDVGGITPGSMPAFSKSIYEEGIIFNGFSLLRNDKINEKQIIKEFRKTNFPSRDPEQNLNDIKAQIASCNKGIIELEKIISSYSLENVNKYVSYIKDNCTEVIYKIIKKIPISEFQCRLDNNALIKAKIDFNSKNNKLTVDFSQSSKILKNNFNTPTAVTKSVVIYFLRTLIQDNLPLNEGALKDIEIRFSENSMLNPKYPSPVVAGNVETSQTLIDVLNGALEIQAACYGTMSNITFGDRNFGYYETICGGEGASKGNNGTDSVHCHMTNTSITDAEILEWNYPVRLMKFCIRKNSKGLGKWNGGNGSSREIMFLKNLDVTILSNRRKVAPFGLKGGNYGKVGINILKGKGFYKKLPSSCQLKVKPGNSIIINTPGGGGFGKAK